MAEIFLVSRVLTDFLLLKQGVTCRPARFTDFITKGQRSVQTKRRSYYIAVVYAHGLRMLESAVLGVKP